MFPSFGLADRAARDEGKVVWVDALGVDRVLGCFASLRMALSAALQGSFTFTRWCDRSATMAEDAVSVVEAGMEVLSWVYEPEVWRDLLQRRRSFLADQESGNELAYALLDDLQELAPDGVVVTTTGVKFGTRYYTFRSRACHLRRVTNINAGWRCLLLLFDRQWKDDVSVAIPFPDQLEPHLRDMIESVLLPITGQHHIARHNRGSMPPSLSDDRIAHLAGWWPLATETLRATLHRKSDDCLVLRPGPPAVARPAGLAAAALALGAVAASFPPAAPMFAMFCVGFGGWSGVSAVTAVRQRFVLDRAAGLFHRALGFKRQLTEIHAVQMLHDVVSKQGKHINEINLVLKTGERVGLSSELNGTDVSLAGDAEEIAGFLGVSLWRG